MSQSQFAAGGSARGRSGDATSLTEEGAIEGVLEALHDADCRAILEATSDEALTVSEICEANEIAQSTAYRKVDMLVDADLLEERTRIRRSGSHVSTYACSVEDVTLSVDEETGIAVDVTSTQTDSPFAGPAHR